MLGFTITESPREKKIWALVLLIISFIIVLGTHPFLKLPFDPWEHLIKIRSIFDDGKCFLYWPENKSFYCSWHLTWATLFSILNIDDTFLWASIIHCSQFTFALVCLFIFSSSVFHLCEKRGPDEQSFLMAIFATLYWLVGNGTYSVEYQQAWVMWYSLTYQGITIPLFWLITGFTLQLFFNSDLSASKKRFYTSLIIAGFLVIAFFHPSEAVYYLIFLLLSLIFAPLISLKLKLICCALFLTILPSVLFLIATYLNLPFSQSVSMLTGFAEIINQIGTIGENIVARGGNRLDNSFSELAIFASVAAFVYWGVILFFSRQKSTRIITLLCTALIIFYLIPTNKWLAGITGFLIHKDIIWRFFFGSPWFLFLPLIIVKLTSQWQFPKTIASLLLVAILAGTFFASQMYFNKALFGNISSLYNSFFKERVGLQYTEDNLSLLKDTIEQKTNSLDKKKVMLYLRGDLATLSRALYGYYALTHRRTILPMHYFYSSKLAKKYKIVPIKMPADFPKDRNIFLHFKLDTKNISKQQDIKLNGKSSILFNLEHADIGQKYIWIEGWALLKSYIGVSSVDVVLQSKQETVSFDTSPLFRRAVGKRFNSIKLENQGFLATIRRSELKPGNYRIGLYVEGNGQSGFIFSERSITIPQVEKTNT
jgi:hypothetical protein